MLKDKKYDLNYIFSITGVISQIMYKPFFYKACLK